MFSTSKIKLRARHVFALFGFALLSPLHLAHAEKADRAKEVEITYAKIVTNLDQSDVTVEGEVVLSQGTMRITGDRMRVKKGAKENVTAEIFGTTSQQLTFREKREGKDEFIEALADRAEFDQGANTLKLISRAVVKSAGNVISHDYLVYNRLTQEFIGDGIPSATKGATSTSNGRGKIVIQPPKDVVDSPTEKK